MFKMKIVQAQYALLNGTLFFMQRLLFKKVEKEKNQIKKILIFRNGSFGDTICALPAIKNIWMYFPDAKIDVMTNSGGENLVSLENIIDNSLVNEFINYLGANKKVLAKKIRNKQYDLLIELPQDQASFFSQMRNIFITKFIFNVPHAFGWEIGATKFFKKQQEKYVDFKDERKRLLDILEKNNLICSKQEFPLNTTEQDIDLVDDLMRQNTLSDESKNIAFVVGSKRHSNRWPIAYFKEVAKHFSQKDFNIIIIGGKEDKPLAKQLMSVAKTYDFTGMLTPMQSAVMLKNCRVTLSNDTGPMHLSYSVETPVVAVFSARDYPNKWFPPEGNIVLRDNDIECSVCFTETCTDNKCMKSITSEIVITYVEKLLQKSENIV